MKVTIYDANNWFRRRIETDLTGKPVSTCFYEIQNQPSFPIIVWDGEYALTARRNLFPEYKAKRKPAGESIYESQDILREVLQLGKGLSIRVKGYEADDVIAHIVHHNKGDEIFIESNDADLAALGKPMARQQFHVEPKWVSLYKTLVGDPSDNISGAAGFGKGTWEKLSDKDKEVLNAVVVSYGHETPERVMEQLEKVECLSTRIKNWIAEKENRKTLSVFYKVVNFIPIPDEVIQQHIVVNKCTPELAHPIFKEYML